MAGGEAEGGDMEERLNVTYSKIRGEKFKARYKGEYQMTPHLRSDSTARPVYEVISESFKEKLEDICREAKEFKVNGKGIWKGITGPPSYSNYWLWGTKDSECGQYGVAASYRVASITPIPLGYDGMADYCYFVDIEVEKC